MVTSGRWVHLPQLSAELPDGWKVSESATFVSPSGHAVWVAAGRADDGDDAESLIDHHLHEIRTELGDSVEQSSSTHPWRGDAVVRSTTLRFEDPAVVRIIAGVVDEGLALRLIGAWPADLEDAADEFQTVLHGIRLLSRPVFEPQTGEAEGPHRRPPSERPALEPDVWARMYTAWSSDQNTPGETPTTTLWSVDELATIATIQGVASFPTVGIELLGMLTDEALHAALGATMRSLRARGAVEIASDGSAVLDDDIATTMDVASFPDLAISVQSGCADGTAALTYFGIRPDDAVRVETVPSGARACGHVDPRSIVSEVMNKIGEVANDVRDERETVQLDADELAERWMAMAAAWQITATWRDDSVVVGRVLYAARDSEGGYWITEPETDDSWTLRPVSLAGVRDELLACLPGAE